MALRALWPYLRVGACPRREAVTGVLVGIGVLMDVVELVCVVSDKSVVGGVIRGGPGVVRGPLLVVLSGRMGLCYRDPAQSRLRSSPVGRMRWIRVRGGEGGGS